MTVKELLNQSEKKIKQTSFSSFDLENISRDCKHLLAKLLWCSFNELFLKYDLEIKEVDKNLFNKQFFNLLQGQPLAYILQEQAFYKSIFYVDSRVLIPRKETEILVEEVLKYFSGSVQFKFVDFGTGSGCIAISLLKELSGAKAIGVDISKKALQVAQKNVDSLGVSSQLSFICGDVKKVFVKTDLENFDFIVANPPYIAADGYIHPFVKAFEPATALLAKNQGLECLLSWAKRAFELLKPKAYYFFEFGEHQKDLLEPHLKSLFSELYFIKDLQGIYRIAVCRKA